MVRGGKIRNTIHSTHSYLYDRVSKLNDYLNKFIRFLKTLLAKTMTGSRNAALSVPVPVLTLCYTECVMRSAQNIEWWGEEKRLLPQILSTLRNTADMETSDREGQPESGEATRQLGLTGLSTASESGTTVRHQKVGNKEIFLMDSEEKVETADCLKLNKHWKSEE